MKGHEFVIACQLNKAPPRAVFVDFSGPADPTLPIPVVVASPSDRDYRWARGLRVYVQGIDSEAIFRAVEALKLCGAGRIIATYEETSPALIWDSEVDA